MVVPLTGPSELEFRLFGKARLPRASQPPRPYPLDTQSRVRSLRVAAEFFFQFTQPLALPISHLPAQLDCPLGCIPSLTVPAIELQCQSGAKEESRYRFKLCSQLEFSRGIFEILVLRVDIASPAMGVVQELPPGEHPGSAPALSIAKLSIGDME